MLAFTSIKVDDEVVARPLGGFFGLGGLLLPGTRSKSVGNTVECGAAEHHGQSAEKHGVELAVAHRVENRIALLDRVEAAAPDRGRRHLTAGIAHGQMNRALVRRIAVEAEGSIGAEMAI